MIGRLADCVITDLLLTELSFGASTMSTGCDCSICCCFVDPREILTPDLQPGKSESNMLIDYVKYSFSLPLKEYSLAPPGIMRGKRLFDIKCLTIGRFCF